MKFQELSKPVRDRLIERNRYDESRVHDDWWDSVYDDFENVLTVFGFDVRRNDICFSGFCSQGDGASFTGTWNASGFSYQRIFEEFGDAKLHRLAREFVPYVARHVSENLEAQATAMLTRSDSRMVHERSVGIEYYDAEGNEDPDAEGFAEACRDLMKWFYWQLEAESDYLHSDEVIADDLGEQNLDYHANGAECEGADCYDCAEAIDGSDCSGTQDDCAESAEATKNPLDTCEA